MTARYAIGLMSGTSLDGVDAACCRISPDGITVESFVTRAYDTGLRDRLADLCRSGNDGSIPDLCRMNVDIAGTLADAAETAREQAGLEREAVTVIGSHGQTVWHDPEPTSLPTGDGARTRATLQIGDGATIAARTGITTVTDFRTADVAVGGHGAPLAPYLDLRLFSENDRTVAAQNIGGISNCTIVPPEAGPADQAGVVAFDTGPGNMVIDGVVKLLTDGERTYDDRGDWAARGDADESLLGDLLDAPYFRTSPPKTTGREEFGRQYARRLVERGRDRGLDAADIVATATELTAASIADAYDRFAPIDPDEIVVSGGGVHNDTLLASLRARLRSVRIRRLDEAIGMDPDAKEAALFAALAVARLDGDPNNVPAATGADRLVPMGKISLPPGDGV